MEQNSPARVTGWEVVQERFSGRIVHVIPCADLHEHDAALDCWCRPALEDGYVVHNSEDGRELFERGQRKFS